MRARYECSCRPLKFPCHVHFYALPYCATPEHLRPAIATLAMAYNLHLELKIVVHLLKLQQNSTVDLELYEAPLDLNPQSWRW